MKFSSTLVVLSALTLGAFGVPASGPNHAHTAEQKANIHSWKLAGFNVHKVDTAVLTNHGWYYHDGTYGGEIVPVGKDSVDDVGYIANMNEEQPIGVFTTDGSELDALNTNDKRAATSCCSIKICGIEVWSKYS
ncbi:hypothetical protein DICA0_D01926 [Diutina catenulata]